MYPFTKRKRIRWTAALVQKEKERIKAELDSLADDNERMEAALQGARALTDDETAIGRLRCYIFLISAAFQHYRSPKMSLSQFEKLIKHAHAILQVEGIQIDTSQLSFLFGEIHHVTSLVYRREGLNWRSAWEQQLGKYVSRAAPIGGQAFQDLAIANRSLRLGNANMAYLHFCEANSAELSRDQRYLPFLGQIRCLRLSGQYDIARQHLNEVLTQGEIPDSVWLEIQWERLCLERLDEGNLTPILRVATKGESHYRNSYLLETFLWAYASQRPDYRQNLTTLRTLRRYPELEMTKLGFSFEVCITLEECYNAEIPIVLRLRKLGENLAEVNQLLNIDQEMLTWVAATRWLAKIRSFQLAALALMQYEALSLRLSSGKNADVLNIAGDLMESQWFSRYQTSNVFQKPHRAVSNE